jgi:hypothetical protein
VPATGPQTTVRWDSIAATDMSWSDPRALDCRVGTVSTGGELPSSPVIGASGTAFPVGTTTVTCVVADEAGNQLVVALSVVVTDEDAPVLTVPAAMSVEMTGTTGVIVTWAVTAEDAVDGDLTDDVTCDPASGTRFARGTHTVTCTVEDAAGLRTTETFTVRVVDSTGPTITLSGGPQSGRTYTLATLPAAPTCVATDTAGPVLQCTVTGYGTTAGRHIITIRARDMAGNVTVRTVTYTVTGTTQPTATPVPPQPTVPPITPVTPVPTTPPTVVPPRPERTPVATPPPTPAPTQPPAAPTRPPRR